MLRVLELILVPTMYDEVMFVEYTFAELIWVVANNELTVIVERLSVLELIFVPTMFVDVIFVE